MAKQPPPHMPHASTWTDEQIEADEKRRAEERAAVLSVRKVQPKPAEPCCGGFNPYADP